MNTVLFEVEERDKDYLGSKLPGYKIIFTSHRLTENERTLLAMRNVVVTPHNAFNSRESLQRVLDTIVENIRAFTDGSPQNVV